MASITLVGDTSGQVSIAAPAVAGSNTLTLQAATATMSVNTLSTAVASTSGTSIDFTALPSWVKRITVMFQGVSTSGTSFTQILLGTGATPTYTTSGYVGGAYNGASTAFSAGFVFSQSASASDNRNGIATLTNMTGNAWAISGATGLNGGGGSLFGGSIALAAALTAVRITTVNGTDTFDAGSINILYEG